MFARNNSIQERTKTQKLLASFSSQRERIAWFYTHICMYVYIYIYKYTHLHLQLSQYSILKQKSLRNIQFRHMIKIVYIYIYMNRARHADVLSWDLGSRSHWNGYLRYPYLLPTSYQFGYLKPITCGLMKSWGQWMLLGMFQLHSSSFYCVICIYVYVHIYNYANIYS